MKIGILALQGAFAEHISILESLGVDCVELRQLSDIDDTLDGLVLPGGESTVQGKLLHELDMFNTLKEKIENGIPVLATCAGLILLAENIENDKNTYFATLPVCVKRNAYGRQLGSFTSSYPMEHIGIFEMTFIRAPYVTSAGNDVEILAMADDKIVGVKYKNQIGLAFHPELGSDARIHKYFLELVNGN